MRRTFATALFLAASLPSVARADPSKTPHAAAEELFVEGRVLLDSGRYAEACEKLARSQAIEGSAGTLMNLADCYEKVGRVASAWSTFREAAAAASDRRRADWVQTATRRAEALQPKVATLTIVVTENVAIDGLVVTCDDVPIDRVLFGAAIPKDPGPHLVTAQAPGHVPWRREVSITSDAEKLTLEIPRLETDARAVSPPADAGGRGARPDADSHATTSRTLAVVAGVSGLVAIGAGATFGLLAGSALDDAKQACPSYPATGDPRCRAGDARAHNDDAKRDALLSTIGFAAGGGLLVGAAVLWFLAPRAASTGKLTVAPVFGGRSVGLGLSGAL